MPRAGGIRSAFLQPPESRLSLYTCHLRPVNGYVASCIPWQNDKENKGVQFKVDHEEVIGQLRSNAAAKDRFLDLVEGCLFYGDPWRVKPIKLAPAPSTIAYWLGQSSHAFVLGHEVAHIMNGDFGGLPEGRPSSAETSA